MNIIMPQLGETVTEGTVTKWYKKVGDAVKADETLFDIETDKVSTEIPSPVAGVVSEICVEAGVTAKVGVTLAVIAEVGSTVQKIVVAAAAPAPVVSTAVGEPVRIAPRVSAAERLSPVVRRLIAERDLDVGLIMGTGRDGRVTRDDVVEFIANGAVPPAVTTPTKPVVAVASAATAPTVPAANAQPPADLLPLNAIRKRVAENMARSWAAAPHVLQVAEADFSRVVQVHREFGEAWKAREGFPLTFMPFVTRAISVALAKYPTLNAT